MEQKMPRVLISYGIPMEGFELPEEYELDYPGEGKAFSREEMMAMLPRADAVLACGAVDADMIKAAVRLKLIVCYGAGYDAIDVDAATRRGVAVANTPDAVTEVTAELTMALMLGLARRVCELNNEMHGDDLCGAFGLGKKMGVSLRGKTLGIVGMGRIGTRVADFGRFMGMRILYCARTPKPEQERAGAERRALEAIMKEADFVSLHCPFSSETKGLISRDLLRSMKSTAYLINTSRGGVVDEEALFDTLQKKRIAGAGLDVFTGEPRIRREWSGLETVILTPHIGSNTLQARREMAAAACKRILDGLSGKKPDNVLNPEAWDSI
jgi:glyoxylate reductase